MRAIHHLMLTSFILGLLGFGMYLFFGYNLLSLNLIHLTLTVYIFSNLPDIDNSNSRITRTFYLIYVLIIFSGGYLLFMGNFSGWLLITAGIIFFLVHFFLAKPGRDHRRFPHTFTFGILSSVILLLFTSPEIAAVGFFCFAMHIAFDNEISRAMKRDFYYIKKVTRIKL